jgi:hypothetical protein
MRVFVFPMLPDHGAVDVETPRGAVSECAVMTLGRNRPTPCTRHPSLSDTNRSGLENEHEQRGGRPPFTPSTSRNTPARTFGPMAHL